MCLTLLYPCLTTPTGAEHKRVRGDRRKSGWECFLQKSKTYYEIPVDVLEDAEELTIWAQQVSASNL